MGPRPQVFIFQQLGYALAPFLSGAIGQAAAAGSTPEASIDDLGSGLLDLSNSTLTYNPQETIVAFWVCMSWSGVGVVFMFAAWQFARRGIEVFDPDAKPEAPKKKPSTDAVSAVSAVSADA